MDFLIFYEHFNREMENIVLLKHQLQRMGYTVQLSHFSLNSYGRHVLFSRPKVVVAPWLRDSENVFRYSRFSSNPKIVNLQWEQIYSENDFKIGIASTTGLALRANHVCWGQSMKRRLISEGVLEGNTKVTGAIQLDFCRREFDSYYMERNAIAQKCSLDTSKKWILFISSFAYATYNRQSLQRLYDEWGDFKEFVDISEKSRIEVLSWVQNLLSENADVIFIYRAHPSENLDHAILNMSNKYPNFKIINDYSVKQWIKVCDSIITWYSTSVAEVFAMGKNFHIIRPILIPAKYEVDILKNANFITTYDDFIKCFRQDCPWKLPIDKTKFDDYFLIGETPAYISVANYLEEILNNSSDNIAFIFTKEEKKKFNYKYKRNILISLLVDFIIYTQIGISKFIPFRKNIFQNIERFATTFSANRIRQIEENIEKVLGQR